MDAVLNAVSMIVGLAIFGFLAILIWRGFEHLVLLPGVGAYIVMSLLLLNTVFDLVLIGGALFLILAMVGNRDGLQEEIRWGGVLLGLAILNSRVPENFTHLIKERQMKQQGIDLRADGGDYTPTFREFGGAMVQLGFGIVKVGLALLLLGYLAWQFFR